MAGAANTKAFVYSGIDRIKTQSNSSDPFHEIAGQQRKLCQKEIANDTSVPHTLKNTQCHLNNQTLHPVTYCTTNPMPLQPQQGEFCFNFDAKPTI